MDEEEPPLLVGPIVEAKPMEEDSVPTERTEHLKPLLQSRKCRIISLLAIMLVGGLIVAVVLLTQNGSKASQPPPPPPAPTPAPTKNTMSSSTFLAELKPLLSSQSLTALDNPDSPQSQSLQWLLEKSNFQDWSFHRQVQRFAMATIYYATGGPSWFGGSVAGGWLTNASECEWFQGFQGGSQGNYCNKKDALVSLEQSYNVLKGTIPDEIGLLTSLNVINLGGTKSVSGGNSLSGTVPSQLGLLTALKLLDLSDNSFNGTVPSQLGSLTALESLGLSINSFTGTVPSELGSLTALSRLDLSVNSFNGTVLSQLGSLTALTYFDLSGNSFNGTVPSQLGSLTALTYFGLSGNVGLTGTVPALLCNLVGTFPITVDCNPGPQCSCCRCYQP